MTINVSVEDTNRPQNSAVGAANLQDYSDNEFFMMNVPTPGGDSVSSVAVGTAGTYTSIPLVSFTSATGSGAAAFASMKAISVVPAAPGTGVSPSDTYTFTGGTFSTASIATVSTTQLVSAALNAAGSGYAPGDTVTLTGGTFSTAAILTVSSTQLVSFAVNAAGTGYAPNNILTLVGGTESVAATVTVTDTQVVSATVATGGSGGTPGTQTVTGTTGTGTKFQASVTVSGGGAITAVLSITVAGDYTANPTVITDEPVTGASLTGAALNVVLGVLTATLTTGGTYTANTTSFTSTGAGTGATFNTALFGIRQFTISTPGSYTVNSATFTQGASSGGGTGATFQTGLYGFLTGTVSTPGRYTVLPTAPVAVTGTGTGVTLTPAYGVDIVTVTNGGSDYATTPDVAFSSGAATATATLSGVDAPSVVGLVFAAPVLSANYDVTVTPSQAAVCSAFNKTVYGCSLQLNPVSGGTLTAGFLDASISFTQ